MVTIGNRQPQKQTSRHACACPHSGPRSIERSEHTTACNSTRVWVVRVPFESEGGGKMLADSVRLCHADALRMQFEYMDRKTRLFRVFPLEYTKISKKKSS